jgi:uncharacterized protein with HEPN domain
MKKGDLRIPDYLAHMQQAIERIQNYTQAMSKAAFMDSPITQDAVIRNLEILGEAAHNIDLHDDTYTHQQQHIPWDEIYLMRNRISHGYFSIDLDTVWNTLQNDLPTLNTQLHTLATQLK